MIVEWCANGVAAFFSGAAAVLWFLSAQVETPAYIPVNVETTVSAYDGSIGAFASSPDLSKLATALRKQAILSKWAATSAGIAAGAATVAFVSTMAN